MSTALHAENHASATTMGVDDGESVVGQSETLGSLAKPLAVARSPVSDGFSAKESLLDPDGVYEKSASQSESAGCLGELSLEKVGIDLGLKQLEAHFVSYLSPMNTSSSNFSSPFSSTPSDFEGSFSVSQAQVASQVGGLVSHPWSASPVGVSGCIELLQKMVFRLSSDRKSFVSSNMVSGGLVSVDTRTVLLEFVPRLVGTSFPEHFLEFLRVGLVGFGASGQEANSFSCKDFLSLSGEVMLVEDVVDFSVCFSETELTNCLPLRIIAPSASSTSAELEEVTEVLSMEAKLNISGWVKHKIPGFCKLVGLSMTRHEKLCIALYKGLKQRWRQPMCCTGKLQVAKKWLSPKTRDAESYET